jgi:hypothetical protein
MRTSNVTYSLSEGKVFKTIKMNTVILRIMKAYSLIFVTDVSEDIQSPVVNMKGACRTEKLVNTDMTNMVS